VPSRPAPETSDEEQERVYLRRVRWFFLLLLLFVYAVLAYQACLARHYDPFDFQPPTLNQDPDHGTHASRTPLHPQ